MLRLCVAKASRAHASRARVTQRCCVFLLSHLSHTPSQAHSFSTHFPHFFSAKSNLRLLSRPSSSPTTPPFVLVNPLFQEKVGHSPQNVGHSPQKVGHFSENNGHFLEKVGHSPRKVGKKRTDQSPRLAPSSTFRASNP